MFIQNKQEIKCLGGGARFDQYKNLNRAILKILCHILINTKNPCYACHSGTGSIAQEFQVGDDGAGGAAGGIL